MSRLVTRVLTDKVVGLLMKSMRHYISPPFCCSSFLKMGKAEGVFIEKHLAENHENQFT